MFKFRFNGTNTSKAIEYNTGAASLLKLYNELVEKKIISNIDYDPYVKAVVGKAGFNYDKDNAPKEFVDWYDWYESIGYKSYDLTDRDIWNLISSEKGNAYYQTIEYYNADLNDYVEVDSNCFDSKGNFIA